MTAAPDSNRTRLGLCFSGVAPIRFRLRGMDPRALPMQPSADKVVEQVGVEPTFPGSIRFQDLTGFPDCPLTRCKWTTLPVASQSDLIHCLSLSRSTMAPQCLHRYCAIIGPVKRFWREGTRRHCRVEGRRQSEPKRVSLRVGARALPPPVRTH